MRNSKSRAGFGLVCLALLASSLSLRGSGISKPVPAYSTVEDEAVGLAQRGTLNMVGAGVTCVDNVPNLRTDCTIAGGMSIDAGTDPATPFNTWIGHQTLDGLTTGTSLTALGYQALVANTDGFENVSVGYKSMFSNLGGGENTAVGADALSGNTSSNENTAMGYRALYSMQTTGYSTALGSRALYLATGVGNIGLGYRAGDNITSGEYNLSIGYQVDPPSATANYQVNIANLFRGDWGTTKWGQIDGTSRFKDSANVASAGTLSLPVGNLFHITGVTAITTVDTCDATNNGRLVTLIFDGVLTFTDGSNLKLAGDFVTSADDVLQMVCDASNWFEVSRSVN